MEKVKTRAKAEKQADSHTEKTMTVERLSEDVGGVVHNLKSALMAVNGYIDLLGSGQPGEIYEQAKRSTGVMETILGNLVFALRAYSGSRGTEPEELSLNACVRSTVELLRTNQVFQSKVRFELALAGDDRICAVSAEAMGRLNGFIGDAAERVLSAGEYVLTVATVREPGRVYVRAGGGEIGFSRSDL
jgi:hypothetical protein